MNRFSVEGAIYGVSRAINEGLTGLEKIQREFNEQINSRQYNEEQIINAKGKLASTVAEKLTEFVSIYAQAEKDIAVKANDEKLAYKPLSDQERIIYLLTKADLKDYYLSLKDAELEKSYSNEGDPIRQRVVEELISTWSQTAKTPNWELKKTVEKAQEARLRESTTKELSFIESKKGLVDYAQKSVQSLRISADALPMISVIWTGLSAETPQAGRQEKEKLNARFKSLYVMNPET